MFTKRFFLMVWATVGLLVAAACNPSVEQAAGNALPSATEAVSSSTQSSNEDATVSATLLSEVESTDQTEGQAEPGGDDMSDVSSESEPPHPGAVELGPTTTYTDETYKFQIDYPVDFVLRTQLAEELTELVPLPLASLTILNPEIASSDLGDLEPADVEVRIYAEGDSASLEDWLISSGLLPADNSLPVEVFETTNIFGLRLCASPMIFPGCFYFVEGNDWVYQLIPSTLEGEAMTSTFKLLP